MNGDNASLIKLLGEEKYDTWRLQVQPLLIKSDLWDYASGACEKPIAGHVAAIRRNLPIQRAGKKSDAVEKPNPVQDGRQR